MHHTQITSNLRPNTVFEFLTVIFSNLMVLFRLRHCVIATGCVIFIYVRNKETQQLLQIIRSIQCIQVGSVMMLFYGSIIIAG